MRACLGEPLSLLDLCRELGVSERTLLYAFREVRGLSPKAYFRAFRLNAVRQELKTAPDTATVHEIAQRWGFWHAGEFAAAYRRSDSKPYGGGLAYARLLTLITSHPAAMPESLWRGMHVRGVPPLGDRCPPAGPETI
jgi:hypothetical protein